MEGKLAAERKEQEMGARGCELVCERKAKSREGGREEERTEERT